MIVLRAAAILSLVGCNHAQPAVPAPVRATVDGILGPHARITRDGASYEGARETKLEVEVSETGTLLATELTLPVKALPAAVAAAVKGPISEAEVVVTPTSVLFSVEVGDIEYMIDPNGTIVSREHETDKSRDDDD